MGARIVLASAVASAAIVVAIGVQSYGLSTQWGYVDFSGFRLLMFFLFLFGWPVAFCLTLAIGVPVLRARERSGRPLPFLTAVLPAMIVGAVLYPVIWGVFWDGTKAILEWVNVPIGGFAGIVGGTCFWLVARSPSQSHSKLDAHRPLDP